MSAEVFWMLRSRGLQADVISWSSLFNACEKGGAWSFALGCLEDALHMTTLNVAAWNALISSCEKAGEWQWSLALLRSGFGPQLLPDVVSFNAAISACERASQWEMALLLFQEVKGDTITVNAFLSALARAAQWRAAIEVGQRKLDVIGGNAVLRACASGRQWQRVSDLMSKMEEELEGNTINAVTLDATLTAYHYAMQWQISLVLLKMARHHAMAVLKKTGGFYRRFFFGGEGCRFSFHFSSAWQHAKANNSNLSFLEQVHGMMPRPSIDPRLSQAPSGCLASGRGKKDGDSEDVVGQQVNNFIKARWGTCPTIHGVSHLAAPGLTAVAPRGSVCRTVSPIRQCGQQPHQCPHHGLYQVNGVNPTTWPQQCVRTCGKQVPFGMLVPTLVTRVPTRGRSAEPAPRGRTHCTAPEPRTMAHQPVVCPCGPSGPSRALSATMLTRGGGQVLVVTGPALPVRTVRQASPVRS
eukprot:symbB.v1.2.035373.t1/scaffold4746.1/size59667/3